MKFYVWFSFITIYFKNICTLTFKAYMFRNMVKIFSDKYEVSIPVCFDYHCLKVYYLGSIYLDAVEELTPFIFPWKLRSKCLCTSAVPSACTAKLLWG